MSLPLRETALHVLRARYLQREASGRIVETPEELFRRVARHVAAVEARFGGDPSGWETRFFEAMARLEFLPNSPTLMNAGGPLGQLAACFVLPVEDSLDSIFQALHDAALIQQSGGGTGYDFSRLRPRGDGVFATGGIASGPVSFMRVFDSSIETIRQGGRRRGANMAVLHASHPDVELFVAAKREPGVLSNFNLSVAIPDAFVEAVRTGSAWELRNPRDGTPVRPIDANALLDAIAASAWETGDPGLVFLDRINRDNPTPALGEITATNPCGEVPLLPYEACMLGSIDVSKYTRPAGMDWERLAACCALGVRFLDDCLEASRFPVARIGEIVRANRKIGLGVMGFADALIELRIPYDGEDAARFAEEVMGFVSRHAREASQELGRERGAFPNFPGSRLQREGRPPLRNATVTAIAPTGTLSLIAGCSSGIEPLFALAYERHLLDGERVVEIHPRLERALEEAPGLPAELRHQAIHYGSFEGLPGVPRELARIFRTAREIPPERHLQIQAAFQRHVDNAVSKTINLPHDATPRDVRAAYERAYELGCKGITVYREGSARGAVLERLDAADGACPECGARIRFAEAIAQCRTCGLENP